MPTREVDWVRKGTVGKGMVGAMMSGGGGYGKVLGRSLWTLVGHPRVGIVFILTLAAWAFVSGTILVLSLVLLTVAVVTLTAYRPHLVADTLKARWRRSWAYGRRWEVRAAKCGLSMEGDVARLRSVEQEAWGERVIVDLPDGLSAAAMRKTERTEALADTFGAENCRVRTLSPGRIALEFSDGRALRETIQPAPIAASTDLSRIHVGRREDGEPWAIELMHPERGYRPLFVAGMTGAGKSGVLWGIVRELAPGLRDGTVELRIIDGKEGVEFNDAQPLCTRYAGEETGPMAKLLAEAVRDLKRRGARMRAQGISQHVPTRSDPVVVIIVDEMGTLLGENPDKQEAKTIERDLRILLRLGRAMGFVVIATTQNPSVETFALRNFFFTAIGLRLKAANQVNMVYGPGSREMGAKCDELVLPGMGYVMLEDSAEAVMVRSAHVTKADIAELVRDYAINAEDIAEVKARVAKLDEIALAAEFDVTADDDDVGEEAGV